MTHHAQTLKEIYTYFSCISSVKYNLIYLLNSDCRRVFLVWLGKWNLLLVCLRKLHSCVIIVKISWKCKGIGLLLDCCTNRYNFLLSSLSLSHSLTLIRTHLLVWIWTVLDKHLEMILKKARQFNPHSCVFLTFKVGGEHGFVDLTRVSPLMGLGVGLLW